MLMILRCIIGPLNYQRFIRFRLIFLRLITTIPLGIITERLLNNPYPLSFPCTMCAGCCRRLHLADQEILKLSGLTHKDGVCDNLDGVTCTIYETRPLICNIERTHELFPETTKAEYFRRNAEICNTFMKEDAFDDFITLEQFDELDS